MKNQLFILTALLAVFAFSAPFNPELGVPFRYAELKSPSLVVAQDDSVLPVVTEDSSEGRFAATFLAGTIRESCGVRPDVYVEQQGQTSKVIQAIFVGKVSGNDGIDCDLAKESEEAFRVVANEKGLHLVGKLDFAVFDWCERELGLRYYYEGMKFVDRKQCIEISAVDYSDKPEFELRQLGWRKPEMWMRVAKCGNLHRGGVSVHQPHGWFREKAMMTHLKDIFEDGKTPMLCYGNERTLRYYSWIIDRHIEGRYDSGGIVDTKRKVITVSQWDAPIRCQCVHCRSLYDFGLGDDGNASPIIWGKFLRGLSVEIANRHPDYMIEFLPYINTCKVPEGLKLPGNCEAEVCTMPGMAMLKNLRCKEREERILRDWKVATGRKVINWHYGCWPREWTAAPYVFGKTIAGHYRDMRDVTAGSYICGGERDVRMALSMYVWMRVLWKSDVNVEAIYDGFARRMFGPAEKTMRKLIAMQEEGWNRQWTDDNCSYHNIFEVSYPRNDVLEMKRLLTESENMAESANDEGALCRVRWYGQGLKEFFAEDDELAERKGRRRIALGEESEMVIARTVSRGSPWAKTIVKTARDRDELVIKVKMLEPAVANMDIRTVENDYVWGNDRVTFAFEMEEGEAPKIVTVDVTGKTKGEMDGFVSKVGIDVDGWNVETRIKLTATMKKKGYVLGNLSRWRVGDRKQPKEKRVSGSRYEHSRLSTCYTNDNADPAAMVEFGL